MGPALASGVKYTLVQGFSDRAQLISSKSWFLVINAAMAAVHTIRLVFTANSSESTHSKLHISFAKKNVHSTRSTMQQYIYIVCCAVDCTAVVVVVHFFVSSTSNYIYITQNII